MWVTTSGDSAWTSFERTVVHVSGALSRCCSCALMIDSRTMFATWVQWYGESTDNYTRLIASQCKCVCFRLNCIAHRTDSLLFDIICGFNTFSPLYTFLRQTVARMLFFHRIQSLNGRRRMGVWTQPRVCLRAPAQGTCEPNSIKKTHTRKQWALHDALTLCHSLFIVLMLSMCRRLCRQSFEIVHQPIHTSLTNKLLLLSHRHTHGRSLALAQVHTETHAHTDRSCTRPAHWHVCVYVLKNLFNSCYLLSAALLVLSFADSTATGRFVVTSTQLLELKN